MSPQALAFEVRGVPAPQGSTRGFLVGGKVRITTANRGLAVWRRLVSDVAQQHAPNPLWEDPLAVTLLFRLPEPQRLPRRRRAWPDRRPDLDKLCRACLDSLTGIVWRDDAQVVRLEASKDYGAPGVMIWVEPIASQEVTPALEESEIGEVDARSIPHAVRHVESGDELEGFF